MVHEGAPRLWSGRGDPAAETLVARVHVQQAGRQVQPVGVEPARVRAVEPDQHTVLGGNGGGGGGGKPLRSLIRSVAAINHDGARLTEKEYDVFISYAHEDDAIAKPPRRRCETSDSSRGTTGPN
jgi:hypothetical protein